MSELQTMSPSRPRDAGNKFGTAQRLENLWRQGHRPDVQEFLSKQEGLTPPQIVAVLCVDQHQRWQVGERIPAETYLSMDPALTGAWADAFELVLGEFRLLQEHRLIPVLEIHCIARPLQDRSSRTTHELASVPAPAAVRGLGASTCLEWE